MDRLNLIWLLICSLLMALVSGCSSDTAYWEFAQAEKMAQHGKSTAALEKMRRAVEQSQYDPELTSRFALKLAESGDRESIQLIDRVLDHPLIKGIELFRKRTLNTKIICLQHLGDFTEALEIVKSILNETAVQDGRIRNDHELNQLAYYRALADQELEQALIEINNAIMVRQATTNWRTGERLDLRSKTILANAILARHFYLHDQRQKNSDANGPTDVAVQQTMLQTAVYLLSRAIEDNERNYLELRVAWKAIRNEFDPLEIVGKSDKVELERQICSTRAGMAVLLTVRALLYQDLQDHEKSQIDRARVAKYKKDADAILDKLPDPSECLELIFYFSAQYLDTRGFILTKLFDENTSRMTRQDVRQPSRIANLRPEMTPSFHNAVFDFDTSIMSTQLIDEAINIGMFNNMNFTVAEVRNFGETLIRMEAVLRYHRLLAYQKQGIDEKAAAEIDAILALGFQPGPQLF